MLRVAGAVAREMAEVDRLAEDERTLATVARRPAERFEPERHDRSAFLHRDHQPPGVDGARIAEALARPFHVDADEIASADLLTRPAERLAVALAPANRNDAHHLESRAEDRDLEQLGLGKEVGDARDEAADQRMVDAREVVGCEHHAAVPRDPLDAVRRGGSERQRDRLDDAAREPPHALGIVAPGLRRKPRRRRDHCAGGDGGRPFSSSRNRCSSWAILSSASSSSSRVTRPTSRKMPARRAAARSLTVASPRQSAPSSSTRACASFRPSRRRAFASLLAGSAMRAGPTPLAAALAFRFRRDALDRGYGSDVASGRRIVSQSETLAMVANDERRISGMFSRIRSKMMIVS